MNGTCKVGLLPLDFSLLRHPSCLEHFRCGLCSLGNKPLSVPTAAFCCVSRHISYLAALDANIMGGMSGLSLSSQW
jgi:hypothetical protein